MNELAHEIIEGFCRESLGGCEYFEMLAGDASSRQYYRVQHADRTYIICHDPAFAGSTVDIYPFYQVHELFSRYGIPVPEVYCYNAAKGLILQEDGGDFLAGDFVADASEDGICALYEKLIGTIVSIQSIDNDGSIPFSLFFDEEKLNFEFSFFLEHALEGLFGIQLSDILKKELHSLFCSVSHLLQRKDLFVLCHRDYHARNVLVTENGFLIIDFQDARMGLPLYDIVSLLRDSYVSLSGEAFSYLKKYYYDTSVARGIHAIGSDEFEYLFNLSAFQRNVKALGTFGYQITKRNKTIYSQYIDRTLGYLETYACFEDEIARPARIILDCIRSRT